MDLVPKDKVEDSRALFQSLSTREMEIEFVCLSAKARIDIKKLVAILKRKCEILLKDETRFTIPSLYKRVAEYLKKLRQTGVFLTGTVNLSLIL